MDKENNEEMSHTRKKGTKDEINDDKIKENNVAKGRKRDAKHDTARRTVDAGAQAVLCQSRTRHSISFAEAQCSSLNGRACVYVCRYVCVCIY